MIVKRYFAPTARDALRALKAELGSGAVVLSNRAVDGGVEIVALPGEAVQSLQNSAAAPNDARPAPEASAKPSTGADSRGEERSTARLQSAPESPAGSVRTLADLRALTTAPKPSDDGIEVDALRTANARLAAELSDIRKMLEQRLSDSRQQGARGGTDARTALTIELLQAGFSPKSVRQLIKVVADDTPIAEARGKVRSLLQRLLSNCISNEDIIDRGGVYALIGPTGVGKTTTTAKLAALYVVRYGAANLALITSDTYRIGAQEQLRIYGRIIGVPVLAVRSATELRTTLASLQNKHMVLIDNTGMSHRDQRISEQAAMLSRAGRVKSLLLLNATSRGETLEDVVRSYSDQHLAGCILTKIDEAPSLATSLDVVLRQKLKIHYLANGQRVPEDLLLPDLETLANPFLNEADRESPWQLQEREALLMLAGKVNQ